MLNNKVFISNPSLVLDDKYKITLNFKDSGMARYLNIGDHIRDTSGNVFAVSNTFIPFADGRELDCIAITNNTFPVADTDYNSTAFTPGQENYQPTFQTTGVIHTASVAAPENYEYDILASWDSTEEANQAIIGSRIIDVTGKEYSITYIDEYQRFDLPFKAAEVHRTGQNPTPGRSTLYSATSNYGFYQGTGMEVETLTHILGRDAAVIDQFLKEAADSGGGGGTNGTQWLGDWESIVIYEKDDMVSYSDGTYVYINVTPSSNNVPPDPLYWDTITPSGGSSGDKTYTYEQAVASAVWNVTHNLSKFPSVSVVDTGGTLVEGEIQYVDENSAIIIFSSSFTGKAFFN